MPSLALKLVILYLIGLSSSRRLTFGPPDYDLREAEISVRLLQVYRHNATFAKLHQEAFGGSPRVKRPIDCPIIPPSSVVPTSVHRVRPGDVQVVAALGDSLTAGRGSNGGIIGLLVDYRGLSWSIGGDLYADDYNTLPNILRRYNPALYGASSGTGDRNSKGAGLNVAETGAESRDLSEQADILISRLQSDPNVNFEEDWKVITVFIGGNDLCHYCEDKAEYTVVRYAANVMSTLDKLHAALPRTFINLVEVLNVEIAQELADNLLCDVIHRYVCNCAANPASPAALEELVKVKDGYQQAMRSLVSSGRYDTRNDFTVVLQPFYKNTYLPRTANGDIDYSYFASDCFHHSEKGQEATGEALWNNMVEPVGAKREAWSPGEEIECPKEESPFLYTSKNSNTYSPKMRLVAV